MCPIKQLTGTQPLRTISVSVVKRHRAGSNPAASNSFNLCSRQIQIEIISEFLFLKCSSSKSQNSFPKICWCYYKKSTAWCLILCYHFKVLTSDSMSHYLSVCAADGEWEAELEAGAGGSDGERPAALRQSTPRRGGLAGSRTRVSTFSNTVGRPSYMQTLIPNTPCMVVW